MNALAELKKRFAPQSRWGAIGLAPRRESGGLTWSDAEDRGQPQDGALTNGGFIADEPQVSSLRQSLSGSAAPTPQKR